MIDRLVHRAEILGFEGRQLSPARQGLGPAETWLRLLPFNRQKWSGPSSALTAFGD